MLLFLFELVEDVLSDRLFVGSTNCFGVVAGRPELTAPEVLLLDSGELSEEFSGCDAFEDVHAFGDGDGRRYGNERMDVIRRNFDLLDLHVVVVGGFDEDLFKNGALWLLEDRVTVLGSPNQMIFQPRDVMLGVL